jgi:hypothetical protein
MCYAFVRVKNMGKLSVTIVFCYVMMGCAQHKAVPETQRYTVENVKDAILAVPTPYRIGAGDTIGVSLSVPSLKEFGVYENIVPSDKSLNNKGYQPFIVTPEGTLRLVGLAEPVVVRGRTRAEIEYLITEHYTRVYNTPNVTVTVLDSRNIAYIQGEIVQPQSIPLSESGTTLADALVAGKIDRMTADLEYIYVIRPPQRANTDPKIYQMTLTTTNNYAVASQFKLQQQDTVWVATRPVTDWSRTINQLFPSGFSNVIDPLRYD